MSDAGGTKYFNPIPMFILFREAIEASIVVSVLLAFLSRSTPSLKYQVWWGVAAGVLISLVLGAIFAILYYVAQNNLFQGKSQFIFKGVVCWIACIFITILAFAMLRYQGWEAKWERKLKTKGVEKLVAAEEEKATAGTGLEVVKVQVSPMSKCQAEAAAAAAQEHPATPRSSTSMTNQNASSSQGHAQAMDSPADTLEKLDARNPLSQQALVAPHPPSSTSSPADAAAAPAKRAFWWRRASSWTSNFCDQYSLFIVVFFTVLREGLESVVFLFGVGNTAPESIPISGLVGILCGVLVGVVLYYSGRQVKDIKWLLFAFATVLFFIAAGAAENGANYLMKGGMFGPYVMPVTLDTLTATGGITTLLWGSDGRPPAPSADSGPATAFSDGDEIVSIGVTNLDDGYVYVMTQVQPWWQATLWDISGCCGDTDDKNKFLSLCKVIFGYNAMPTFIDCIFYLGFWLVVLSWGMWKWHKGTLLDADYKHNRMMEKQREQALRDKVAALDSGIECSYSLKQAAAAEGMPPSKEEAAEQGEKQTAT